MTIVSIIALIAALLGAVGGYTLSKHAVEWCPTCGRSLSGHCPEPGGDPRMARHPATAGIPSC